METQTRMQKLKDMAKRHLLPTPIVDWQRAKEKADEAQRTGDVANSSALKNFGRQMAKRAAIMTAFVGIYAAVGSTVGVSSTDWKLNGNAQEIFMNDTSAVSLQVARKMVNAIPSEMKPAVSRNIVRIEETTALARAALEQALFIRTEYTALVGWAMTPDRPATFVPPAITIVAEIADKETHYRYPTNQDDRLMVGAIGIYGNLVRVVEAALMWFGVPALVNALTKRRKKDEAGDEPKRE